MPLELYVAISSDNMDVNNIQSFLPEDILSWKSGRYIANYVFGSAGIFKHCHGYRLSGVRSDNMSEIMCYIKCSCPNETKFYKKIQDWPPALEQLCLWYYETNKVLQRTNSYYGISSFTSWNLDPGEDHVVRCFDFGSKYQKYHTVKDFDSAYNILQEWFNYLETNISQYIEIID